MKTLEIFQDIKDTFGDLWKYKERGKSLEIITPYATSNNSFVSVFFTIRGGEYIFSDGGWLTTGEYGYTLNDHLCFQKLFDHFQNSFSVLKTSAKDGTNYYYAKTNNLIDIPSRLFDITLFIQGVINSAAVEFSEGSNVSRTLFNSRVNSFMKENFNDQKIHFNAPLIPDREDLKFNVLYNYTPNVMILMNYITGSTESNFTNSIWKTNGLFGMAEQSYQKDFIHEKVALIDDSALGFNPSKNASYIEYLQSNTHSEIVKWSERKRLLTLFN